MKAINELVREIISKNVFSVQCSNNGTSTTDDSNADIAKFILENYDKKANFEDFKNDMIDCFYRELELSDSDFDEQGETYNWLKYEVERYINNNLTLRYRHDGHLL